MREGEGGGRGRRERGGREEVREEGEGVYLQISRKVRLDEWHKFLGRDIVEIGHILPHVLLQVDETSGGCVLVRDAEELHYPISCLLRRVNLDEQDLQTEGREEGGREEGAREGEVRERRGREVYRGREVEREREREREGERERERERGRGREGGRRVSCECF